jgi:hypothetical protein
MVGDRGATVILLLTLFFLMAAIPNIDTVRAVEDSWTTGLKPVRTIRSQLGVVAVNGKIYAIGGGNDGGFLSIN